MSVDARCPNCEAACAGDYCAACGQKLRIVWSARELYTRTAIDFGHLDHVVARTLFDLLRRPAALIRDNLRGRTQPYARPFGTLTLVASAYFLLVLSVPELLPGAMRFHVSGAPTPEQQAVYDRVREGTAKFAQYAYLAVVPIAALLGRMLSRAPRRSYGEWVLIQAYVYCGLALLELVLALPFVAWPEAYERAARGPLAMLSWAYATWALRGVLDIGWVRAVFHALLATMLPATLMRASVSLGVYLWLHFGGGGA
ncbi:MAG: DUF3667 domain-containing protein [Planctomycetota bacterium]|nr:MAG: DUF3667 domain-containing protein [Planctomycetota bacterium]